jgi:hypothetical protein
MLCVFMLCVFMLCVVLLRVVKLSVIFWSFVMLIGIMLSVIIPRVVASLTKIENQPIILSTCLSVTAIKLWPSKLVFAHDTLFSQV